MAERGGDGPEISVSAAHHAGRAHRGHPTALVDLRLTQRPHAAPGRAEWPALSRASPPGTRSVTEVPRNERRGDAPRRSMSPPGNAGALAVAVTGEAGRRGGEEY